MDMKNSKLFSPLKIRGTTLQNRIAMAPMSMDYESKDGTVNKKLADVFVRRAEGGVGIVVIDAVTVDHKYWYMGATTSLDDDKFIPDFKAFADRVSATGSTLIPQIVHPGPESICALRRIAPLGPSINTNANGHVSRPMTEDEIWTVIRQYGAAAKRAEIAGCGGVSLHTAHAYMMPGAFLSPLRNRRMDDWGGTIDNRARFIIEVIKEVRRCVSEDFPITLRVSGSERIQGGNSLEEMLYLAPKFEAAGVDLLEVSGGVQYEALENILPSNGKPIGMNVYEASEIKKVVNIPVFAVGKINDIRYGADLVERGLIDGISLGRPLLADPDLPNKALNNDFDGIIPCGSCGGSCITRSAERPHCECHVNPEMGHEYEYPAKPIEKVKKLLVIGAGPGGMYTAAMAAERGHDVTVWEAGYDIGGQLKLAVTTPGKQEMTKWMVHLNYRCKKAGVKFEFGKEATVEMVKEFAPDACVVATGAKPLVPMGIPGVKDMTKLYTAQDFLKGAYTVPNGRICILGGGEVACETAETMLGNARTILPFGGPKGAINDIDITIVEMQPQLLAGVCIPNRAPVLRNLHSHGVHVNVNTKVLEINDNAVKVQRLEDGTEEWLTGFDKVIFGMGARAYDPLSEELKAFVPEVFVIGDAVKPGQSRDAMHAGFKIAYEL